MKEYQIVVMDMDNNVVSSGKVYGDQKKATQAATKLEKQFRDNMISFTAAVQKY